MCRALSGYECVTAVRAGFRGLRNGALLDAAEHSGFDALITVDNNLPYQNRVQDRRIAVVILRARSNQIDDLLPLSRQCREALRRIKPGEVVRVGRVEQV